MLEQYDETVDCDNEYDYDVENNDDMNNELGMLTTMMIMKL